MTFSASGPGVRTHRRGGKGTRRTRRRKILAPWIIVTAVSVLVVSLLTAGFVYLIAGGCSGTPEQVNVLASTSISGSLKNLARSWLDSEPSVDGRCVSIDVQEKDSADVQQALSPDWDVKRNGTAPDVWIPESTAWARMAADREATARLIPDIQPSIASSSAVIAMPKVMAEALGWPEANLDWPTLIEKAEDPDGWGASDHPEWGEVRIGMSNPLKSTASLLALLAMVDTDGDTDINEKAVEAVVSLKKSMAVYEADDPSALTTKLRDADTNGAALAYLSAFPALERDVLLYNSVNPQEPLAAVYPTDGAPEADNPYLILQNAPWVSPVKQDAAAQFLDYVRGEVGREEFISSGFRDANRIGGPDLSEVNGLSPQIGPPREAVQPAAVTNTLATWTALNRTTNLLFVMDTSESMNAATTVDGKNTTLMEVAKDAVKIALNMIGDQSRVGLWQFSEDAGLGAWQTLVEMEPLDKGNRDALSQQIGLMQAGGTSALYDTALAAYDHVTENYLAEATNMVVILTAGANNNPNGGVSLEDLTNQLTSKRDPNRPVSLMTIGYGEGADETAMQQISAATKGQYFASTWPGEISKTLLNALFNAQ